MAARATPTSSLRLPRRAAALRFSIGLALACGAASVFSLRAPGAIAQPASAAAPDEAGTRVVTERDQTEVAVTVYNSNLALVRDVRRVQLAGGAVSLRFEDIASGINPAAVHVRSLTSPDALGILEQNYQYNLLEPMKLLQKYVGREVTLVRARQENGTTRYEETKATLLALNNGAVWRVGGEIVTGLPSDHYRFPELPDNLYKEPTLLWKLQNDGPREHRLEVAYLTGGLAWNADYVLTVARDDKAGGLDGWVTLQNDSGASYRDARLQLVAGGINRVYRREDAKEVMETADRMRAAAPAPQFSREAFSEYHLYSLTRRTTVGEKETKQISLLGAASLPLEKRFVVNGDYGYYRAERPGAAATDQVEVYYRFRNAEEGGLGQPLPAGVVRVYQADAQGGLQFVGEDRIRHTPKDETVDLHTGNAFDVVAERKQTDYRRIASDVWEVAYEVRLRNRKATPIRVEVNEPIGGDWEMLRASLQWEKTAAFAARFDVAVAAGGETVLSYRVRIK